MLCHVPMPGLCMSNILAHRPSFRLSRLYTKIAAAQMHLLVLTSMCKPPYRIINGLKHRTGCKQVKGNSKHKKRESPTLHTFHILLVTSIFGYFRQKNYAPSNLTWPGLEPMTFGSRRCPFKGNCEHKMRESPSLHTFHILLVTSIFGYLRQKNFALSNFTWPGFEPVTFGSWTLYIPQSYVDLLSDWRSLRKTKTRVRTYDLWIVDFICTSKLCQSAIRLKKLRKTKLIKSSS